MQIVEVCQVAADGSLWYSSPDHSFGVEDPRLWEHVKTCASGVGVSIDDNTYVMGWPAGGKPKGALQYIAVRGGGNSTDMYEHTFSATGQSLGFVVSNDEEWTTRIGELYMSFGIGE